ncbi:MAG TPA: type II CAAX endopeptidase family protein [Acidobacteriota bacterium]|nr:type II CAAX endopeptidase family protein [Acidobacteriota bacterium]
MHEPNEALTGDTVPTRRPTRWRNAVEVLVVATTGFVVIPLAAAAVGYDPNLFLTTIEGFVSLLTLEAVVTLSLIWILLRWREQDLSLLSRIPRNWKTELVLGAAVVPVLFLIVVMVTGLVRSLAPGWTTLENPLLDLVTSPSDAWLLVLSSIFVGGFKEEIQRAFVLERFRENLGGPWVGLILWSVFFGYGHALQGIDNAVAAGVLGLVFGWLYLSRGCLVAPITAHATFNTCTVLLYWFLSRS